MQTSPSSSPSPFVKGLEYSCDAAGKRTTFGSLARRTQELGAELCGRLSQIVLHQSLLHEPHQTATSPIFESFMSDVQRDLSAHYGSHALRRGLAKPFGPCVRPVLRKGKLTIARGGVHGPRSMRLWRLHRAHRCWCPQCGVWLTRGMCGGASARRKIVTLPTLVECRVRRRGRRTRDIVSTKKFRECCARCLAREQKAAARAAGSLGGKLVVTVSSDQSAAAAPPHPTKEAKKKAARAARQKCARATAKTLEAVVAAAQLPRRNRRCRRRSARRPRKAPAQASAKVSATLKATAQLRQALLATPLTSSPATKGKAATVAGTAAPAKPAGASAAQKTLQGLVPSGPLKKQFSNAPRPKSGVSVTAEVKNSAKTLHEKAVPASTATLSSNTVAETREIGKLHRPGTAPENKLRNDATREATSSSAVGTDTTDVPFAEATATRKGEFSTSPSVKSAGVSKTSIHPVPPVSAPIGTGNVAETPKAAVPLPTPKGPPMKAMPKKAAKPPAKVQTKTSGKAKLMNAMNQLGF